MCREINLKSKYNYFFNIKTVILTIPTMQEQTILIISDAFGGIKRYPLIPTPNPQPNTLTNHMAKHGIY